MLRSILGASLRARGLLICLAGATLVVGVTQLHAMPVEVLPEVAPPTVEIQTESLGLSAAEVEQLITVPLEQDLLNGLPWLDVIRSASIPGLSSIELVFQPGTDLLRARQLVQERLSQAHALPNVSSPPQMLPPRPTISRVMMIRLSSDRLSPIEMSVLARWTIRPRLLGVPGVANVSIWGQRERQLQVRVEPERLRHEGVSLFQVIESAGNALWASPLSFLEASTPGTGGFIDTPIQRLAVQHLQPIARAADLARVPIQKGSGPPVRLADVADVVEGHQPLIGDAVFADGPSLLLVVERFPDAGVLDVTRGIDEAFDALRPGLPGMTIDTHVYRAATYVHRSMHNVSFAAVSGLMLMVLVLIALLFEWRTALVVTVSVLVTLMVAALVLLLRGEPINLVVLAGLLMAVAVVIDDATGDVATAAARLRRQRMNGGGPPLSRLVLETAGETRSAMVFAGLILVVSAVPLFFVPRPTGALFSPLAVTYLLTVGASMLVATTVTPALSAVMLANAPLERRGSPIAAWLQRGYRSVLSRLLRAPRYAVGVAVVAAVAGLAVVPFLSGSTLPLLRDSDVLVRMTARPGTSLPAMRDLVAGAETDVRSVPGVVSVGAHIGRALMSDELIDVNSAELWARLAPEADLPATMTAIRRNLGRHPGFDFDVGTYPNDGVDRILSGPDRPIVVQVYGQDPAVLHATAERVRRMLNGVDGIVAPRVEHQVREPVLDVRVDLGAARRYGIKPGDVRRAAATLLSGIAVGSLFEHQKVFDVVVWGAPDVRATVADVRNLLIDTPDGGHVRLGDVAHLSLTPNLAVIRHENVSRTLAVSANVRGRDVDAVAADASRELRGMPFPLEYHAELAGDFVGREASARHLLWIGVAAAIGVLLLLQAAVGSWRLAAMLFVVLALALAGPAVASFLDGRVVSVGTIAGAVATIGIAARAGVVLVRHWERLAREEPDGERVDRILRASRDRLLPTVIAGAATAAVLAPVLVSGPVAGEEILHPLAVALLGGLVATTALTLFVVPPAYALVAPRGGGVPEPAETRDIGPVIDLTVHGEPGPAGAAVRRGSIEPVGRTGPVGSD